MYAIVDIETTGGRPKTDKITEIAVLVHDGKKIVKEFGSLINPECRIPYYISAITGITNEMVEDAPRFYEVARQIVELTENCIFVAHNVGFDYNFIKSEFSRLGYEFKREQLCTVRLSRKLIPGKRSYSLGKLCDELNIHIHDRHRAMGDAVATSKLFDLLLGLDENSDGNTIKGRKRLPRNVHPDLDISKLTDLPEEPGVYYFFNADEELIYVGKSKSIKDRVLSHFSNNSSQRALEMTGMITRIDFELTGNELIALLKESEEIKRNKPYFNRAQRRSVFQYGLYHYIDSLGYMRFQVEKTSLCTNNLLLCFTSKTEAKYYLNSVVEKYELCQKLCGLYPTAGSCFHYEIGACKGACTGKESPADYNKRAEKFIVQNSYEHQNMLIIAPGRELQEKSVVKIENGKYVGYGYFNMDYAGYDSGVIMDCIRSHPDNREVLNIIKHYLRTNTVEKIMVF